MLTRAALNTNHATAAGVLCVSSVGNEGVNLNSRLWSIPAQSGNGMAVAATGPCGLAEFDRPASYTNYGQSVINVAAPGGDYVCGTSLDMVLSPAGRTSGGAWQYYFAAGTSMAAPHVSGVAALMVGRYGKMKPSQLKAIIEQTADDILKAGADPFPARAGSMPSAPCSSRKTVHEDTRDRLRPAPLFYGGIEEGAGASPPPDRRISSIRPPRTQVPHDPRS